MLRLHSTFLVPLAVLIASNCGYADIIRCPQT